MGTFVATRAFCKQITFQWRHMSIEASEIIEHSSVCSTDHSAQQQRKSENSALPALCEGNPLVVKVFPCHDVIMIFLFYLSPWVILLWEGWSTDNHDENNVIMFLLSETAFPPNVKPLYSKMMIWFSSERTHHMSKKQPDQVYSLEIWLNIQHQ